MTNTKLQQEAIDTAVVKYKIYKELERVAHVDAQNISVDAIGGKVFLSGDVETSTERQHAEQAVWAAPGVSDVQNNIRIAEPHKSSS